MQGSAGPEGIYYAAWKYWTMSYGYSSQDLQKAIYTLVRWLANIYPSWVAYQYIVAGFQIGMEKC